MNFPIGLSGRTAHDVAIEAAKLAAREITTGYSKAKRLRYKGIRDIVTDTDVAAEKVIMDTVRYEFPDHAFLAEESGVSGDTAEYKWIIDPLDGTLNFSQNIPIFCISIALACRGEVILGLIYDPMVRELFLAVKGQGATLNGKPIWVTRKTDLLSAVLGFDLGYDEESRRKALDQSGIMLPQVRTLRLIGSAAIALAYTAAGRLDIFYHHWLYPWDFAAGALLVSEAGGLITDWQGKPVTQTTRGLIASNKALHSKLVAALK